MRQIKSLADRRRESSHATAATAAASSLSGCFEISVNAAGRTRRVTECCRITHLRVRGLHLAWRSVAQDARVMFPGDVMLHTRCFAHGPLRHRRCDADESGGRKYDDRFLHLSVLLFPGTKSRSRDRNLVRYGERAASRGRRWRLRRRSRHVSHAKQRTLNFKGHSRADAPVNGERPCSVGEGNAGRLFQRLG
jgi:hypothetical protein